MDGEQLGKYELLRRIASGGMAELYLARAKGIEGFEKMVVIKRILPELIGNQEIVTMFLDEARIAGLFHHPNIVQVYDIGTAGGDYFFSMEFLHGADVRTILRESIARGITIPIESALSIIIHACAGLHYAHDKVGLDGKPLSIIHRDVSPQNIFVTYDGNVKVVDFGIAKTARRAAQTRYGVLKGKYSYMSPEQCRSEPLDRRSDVFSLSIVLYELTVQRKLYRGSEFEVLKAIVESDAPPPSKFRPDYPKELERIVMRGLARDRNARYASAQELQEDLEELARERKLSLSSISLARFMEHLFRDSIEAWRDAQRNGLSLSSHLTKGTDPSVHDPPHAPQTAIETTAEPVAGSRPRRRSRVRAVAIAAGLLAGLTLVGLQLTRSETRPATHVPARVSPPPPVVSRPVAPAPPVAAAEPPAGQMPAPEAKPVPKRTSRSRNAKRSAAAPSRSTERAVPERPTTPPSKPWDPDAPLPF